MSASFITTAVWGLLVLFACVGWGGVIERWLFDSRAADAGLRGVWGMALALFVMPLLALFSLASKPAIFAFVAFGVILGTLDAVRRARAPRGFVKRWGGGVLATLVALSVAAAGLQYLASIWDLRFNVNDDYIAYFPFAKQIVQRGTLFDPFSTRLAMSWGGQSFLHALVLAGAPSFRLHMLDSGLCVILAVMLIIGSRKDEEPAWPVVVALLVFLTLPVVKINTHSQFSGVVIFYGLFRTLVWIDESESRRPIASAAILALTGAAACSLRLNYIAVAVPLLAFSYAHCVWKSEDRRARVREAAIAAVLGLVFLAPWMILAFRSTGTPLFPLIRGHFNDAFPMLQKPTNFAQEIADIEGTLAGNSFLPMFPLFVLAGFLVPDTKQRKPLRSLLLATAIGWLMLISALASDIPSFLRYVYGFVVAVVLAAITRSAVPSPQPAARLGKAAVVIAALIQLVLKGEYAVMRHEWLIDRVVSTARLPLRIPEETPLGRVYAAMQGHVPPRVPLLVQVDYPYLLDFKRNDIYNVDTAAAVSPPPGFPYFQGSERIANYLRGTGVRYFAFVKPDRAVALYRRDVWEKELRGRQPLWHAQAPVFLDMFKNFEELARRYPVVYEDGALILLDLNPTTSSPPRP